MSSPRAGRGWCSDVATCRRSAARAPDADGDGHALIQARHVDMLNGQTRSSNFVFSRARHDVPRAEISPRVGSWHPAAAVTVGVRARPAARERERGARRGWRLPGT
ncbi:hypothetical protein ZWY2020_038168 [Hordeum vulgare]|nr:hypothetical protein ZWY2020_038168 [Hordeum vulgare]